MINKHGFWSNSMRLIDGLNNWYFIDWFNNHPHKSTLPVLHWLMDWLLIFIWVVIDWWLIYSFIHSSIHSSIHSFIYSSIHSSINSFIHWPFILWHFERICFKFVDDFWITESLDYSTALGQLFFFLSGKRSDAEQERAHQWQWHELPALFVRRPCACLQRGRWHAQTVGHA
jgi:hypothetical protein